MIVFHSEYLQPYNAHIAVCYKENLPQILTGICTKNLFKSISSEKVLWWTSVLIKLEPCYALLSIL